MTGNERPEADDIAEDVLFREMTKALFEYWRDKGPRPGSAAYVDKWDARVKKIRRESMGKSRQVQ